MAKPVVSTAVGAEGLAVEHGRHVLVADEPQRFADSVGSILDDSGLAERLGRAGRSLVEERYRWEALGNRLVRFIEKVLSS